MTDPVPPDVPPDVPHVPIAPRRSFWQRVSLVWLVPILALVAALAVAWQGWSDRGPLIEIVFDDAAGVVARETELRFRNVAVGVVESVDFTPGLEQVVVGVRVDPEVAPYVDRDASFWVVRPRISTQQITGIETVLSGVFIQGVWDNQPGEPGGRFEGRTDAPLLDAGQEGLEFTLYSNDGTLTSITPILYNGVVAGQTGEPRLAADGFTIEADAVVFAPFDRLVNEATRFYDASGFRLAVGGAGAEVDFDSIGALLQGGLAFENFVSGAVPARDGDRFRAFYSEDLARDSLVADPDTPVLELSAVFSGGPVAGLAQGAPVTIEGVRVGDVTQVLTLIDPERFGDSDIHLQASFALQPSRLGLTGEEGRDAILDWLEARVAEGLRARLATASILGGLRIELVAVPGAPPAGIDLAALPFPALPVTAAEVTDFAGTAEGLIARVDDLPIEELLASATALFDRAGALIGGADAQGLPAELNGLLADLRGVTASPEVQALPADVRAALAEIEGTAADLRALLASLEEQRGVERVLAAVDRAGEAAGAVTSATEGLPALVARLDAVAAKAEALAVEPILSEIQGLAAEARGLLADPAFEALPARIGAVADTANATLTEAQGFIAEARGAELPGQLAETLASVREVAGTIDASTAGLPRLIERLDAVAARAQELDLQPLVAELTATASEARSLLAQPSLRALPADLSAALAEVEALLQEARAADVVGSLNATLASARAAAETLPGLVARAGGLLDQAGVAVTGFADTSGLVREAQSAIRDVAQAASAIADLARAIERDPNSLLFGR